MTNPLQDTLTTLTLNLKANAEGKVAVGVQVGKPVASDLQRFIDAKGALCIEVACEKHVWFDTPEMRIRKGFHIEYTACNGKNVDGNPVFIKKTAMVQFRSDHIKLVVDGKATRFYDIIGLGRHAKKDMPRRVFCTNKEIYNEFLASVGLEEASIKAKLKYLELASQPSNIESTEVFVGLHDQSVLPGDGCAIASKEVIEEMSEKGSTAIKVNSSPTNFKGIAVSATALEKVKLAGGYSMGYFKQFDNGTLNTNSDVWKASLPKSGSKVSMHLHQDGKAKMGRSKISTDMFIVHGSKLGDAMLSISMKSGRAKVLAKAMSGDPKSLAKLFRAPMLNTDGSDEEFNSSLAVIGFTAKLSMSGINPLTVWADELDDKYVQRTNQSASSAIAAWAMRAPIPHSARGLLIGILSDAAGFDTDNVIAPAKSLSKADKETIDAGGTVPCSAWRFPMGSPSTFRTATVVGYWDGDGIIIHEDLAVLLGGDSDGDDVNISTDRSIRAAIDGLNVDPWTPTESEPMELNSWHEGWKAWSASIGGAYLYVMSMRLWLQKVGVDMSPEHIEEFAARVFLPQIDAAKHGMASWALVSPAQIVEWLKARGYPTQGLDTNPLLRERDGKNKVAKVYEWGDPSVWAKYILEQTEGMQSSLAIFLRSIAEAIGTGFEFAPQPVEELVEKCEDLVEGLGYARDVLVSAPRNDKEEALHQRRLGLAGFIRKQKLLSDQEDAAANVGDNRGSRSQRWAGVRVLLEKAWNKSKEHRAAVTLYLLSTVSKEHAHLYRYSKTYIKGKGNNGQIVWKGSNSRRFVELAPIGFLCELSGMDMGKVLYQHEAVKPHGYTFFGIQSGASCQRIKVELPEQEKDPRFEMALSELEAEVLS